MYLTLILSSSLQVSLQLVMGKKQPELQAPPGQLSHALSRDDAGTSGRVQLEERGGEDDGKREEQKNRDGPGFPTVKLQEKKMSPKGLYCNSTCLFSH